MRLKLAVFASVGALVVIVASGRAQANPLLDPSATNTQMEQQLEGPGISIQSGSMTTITGFSSQFGVFTNGDVPSGPGPTIGIDSGVYMATGVSTATGVPDFLSGAGGVRNAVRGPNDAGGITSNTGGVFADPQLTGVVANAVFDPVVLQLRATPSGSFLKVTFVFASDEYPEFVCSRFNDAFGFFVKPTTLPDVPANWTNIAVLPGTSTPIAINTLNGGVCGAFQDGSPTILSNSNFYVDNGTGSTPANNANLQYDGFTIPFVVEAPVSAGVQYDVKLAIADAGDPSWDGAVFVKWLSSSNFADDVDIQLDLSVDNAAPTAGDNVVFTVEVTNTGQDAASSLQVNFDLPAGFTHVSDTSGGNYNPTTGIWTLASGLPGSGGTASFQVTATATSPGAVSAFAEVSSLPAFDLDSTAGNGPQSPAEDDEDAVALIVAAPPAADLSLQKTVDDQTPATGQNITYTLGLANAGPADAAAIEVGDRLPAGLAYVSHAGTGNYDPSTGVWTVGAVPAAGSASLQIIATVLATGDLTNRAEITASDRVDPDSDPAVSFAIDDAADGIADDDEAELTVVRTDLVIEGRIIADDGRGGGTAHDAIASGSEIGLGGLAVEAFDAGGAPIAAATTAGDGSYRLLLPPTLVGAAVTLRTGIAAAHLRISEGPGALPGLANPSATDGEITFTPAAPTTYPGIDFGQIAEPTLTASRTSSATAGSTLQLAHIYTASSSGTVTFSLSGITGAPPAAFTTTLFHDADCNGVIGAGEGVLAAPVAVSAGDEVCLLARVAVAAGAPQGATLAYDVLAATAFSGTSVTHQAANADTVTVVERSEVEVSKRVRNVTQAGSFGTSNAARPGEVLEYSVLFTNPGKGPAFDVRVLDKTPVFTSLSVSLPAITSTPAGMTCAVVIPAGGGVAGYRGPLEWACTGSMTPGTSGEVRFRVQLDP